MKIRFSKLNPRAVVPKQMKPGDAGFDLTAIAVEHHTDSVVPYINYEFGLAVEIPEGYVGLLFPRSSISDKDLMLTNSVGVIDSGYRGPLSARFKSPVQFKNIHMDAIQYKVGDRVAQLVIVPYLSAEMEEVPYEDLSKTERGQGGFGSTNVKIEV